MSEYQTSAIPLPEAWGISRLEDIGRVASHEHGGPDGGPFIRISIQSGDKLQSGKDGQRTERAELTYKDTLPQVVQWQFRLNEPILRNRTVIAQIKDTSEAGKDKNPVLAIRIKKNDENCDLVVTRSGKDTNGNMEIGKSSVDTVTWHMITLVYISGYEA
jgi:hypothetical protein